MTIPISEADLKRLAPGAHEDLCLREVKSKAPPTTKQKARIYELQAGRWIHGGTAYPLQVTYVSLSRFHTPTSCAGLNDYANAYFDAHHPGYRYLKEQARLDIPHQILSLSS